MATYTSYLNLEKPTTSETFNLLKMNQNWDKIDQGVSALNSKITNSLKSGQNSIGNIIVPGYNTGSGNYFDFFVPCSTGGKTVTSASLAYGTVIYLPTTIANFSSAPEVTVSGQTDYGVRLEVKYPSTNTPNICGTIYAINVKLTCS